jgi:SpoVK/Ycf46/Vps4 family AAA+-type ATPase
MSSKKPNKQNIADRFLVDLVSAGLEGDSGKVELAALSLSRILRNENPEISKKINETISSFALNGGAFLRSAGEAPLPVDNDTHYEMATTIRPNDYIYKSPILSSTTNERIESFLDERRNMNLLLEKGIRPSTSLLLIGQPGTGKTMLARHIATQLDKTLVVLDLSASISSLMGKTGHNLKKVLQYAKQNASVLLLDEFDAIAKRRDDNTDLGEIKRVVNVLLMELEDWPISSVIIATSNHPELLDRAIWRRFDHTIEMPLPEKEQRLQLLQSELVSFFSDANIKANILEPLSELLVHKSAADVCKFSNNVKRRIILKNESPMESCLHELELYTADKKVRGKFCVLAKEMLGEDITIREIAEITGLSPAGVQHHISKSKSKS